MKLSPMKPIRKVIYLLIVSLLVVSGLVLANRGIKNESNQVAKPISLTNNKASFDARQQWEASADGIKYKQWEVSAAGKKVHASHEKIKKYIKAFTSMEAVVTSVNFKRKGKSSGIKWLIVRIDGEEYMMQFSPKDFRQLSSLNVNDKIIVRSRSAGFSPNHPYLIISGDDIVRNNKTLFKRDFSKNKNC